MEKITNYTITIPKKSYEIAYREAGLLKRNITAEWDMVKGEAVKYVEKMKTTDKWAVFFGETGTYKSTILSCFAKDKIRAGKSVIYGTAKELIDNINETPIDERRPVKDRLKQVDILIIDEVGRNSDTDAFRNTLFDIVQYRERDELQTLMATNKKEAEFWNKYLDEAFQRRFEENGIIINF